MNTPPFGQLIQFVGLAAAPDLPAISRVSSIMRWAAGGMDGSTGGIVGYDRGDAVHSYNGPVRFAPSPTAALNRTGSPGGIYRPVAEFQNGISQNISLDPYNRALYARMVS